MKTRKSYLNIEKKLFTSLDKIGYIIIFTILFSFLMIIVDFILHCFVDNYFTSKFIFTGEMHFNEWLKLMWNSYYVSYFKIVLFAIIFVFIAIYRCKALSKKFLK